MKPFFSHHSDLFLPILAVSASVHLSFIGIMHMQPPKGFVSWSEETFEQLASRPPEALRSQFSLSHSAVVGPLMHNNGVKEFKDGYLTEIFTDAAIEFLKRHQRSGSRQDFRSEQTQDSETLGEFRYQDGNRATSSTAPFFLTLSYNSVQPSVRLLVVLHLGVAVVDVLARRKPCSRPKGVVGDGEGQRRSRLVEDLKGQVDHLDDVGG